MYTTLVAKYIETGMSSIIAASVVTEHRRLPILIPKKQAKKITAFI